MLGGHSMGSASLGGRTKVNQVVQVLKVVKKGISVLLSLASKKSVLRTKNKNTATLTNTQDVSVLK